MTEIIWEGKYQDGKRVPPVRIALPFQTVETVNESAQERQKALDMFSEGHDSEWRSRLIWGDKKYVLPSLLPEFAGKVNLIYIDPPFDTGADFSFTTTIPESAETFIKEPSVIEQKAYRDTWGKGLDSYLKWFYETVVILRELLSESGSIFVHLDWHVGHYAKVIMDEVFGVESFSNDIVWHYEKWTATSKMLQKNHDCILHYTKGTSWTFNEQREITDNLKEKYKKGYLIGGGGGSTGLVVYDKDNPKVKQLIESGNYKVVYANTSGKPISDVWQIPFINPVAGERLNYPTQKPEALLERIIKISSNKDDLVLDCFCGSGTTAAVAEKLGRRWITCDLGRFAIHTARKRLLAIEGVKPFSVQDLGKYERQQWQATEFGENVAEVLRRYREFILNLYKARPLSGYVWLHGVKNSKMVHIGSVDGPVTVGDVQQIAIEFRKVIGNGQDAPEGNGVDVLGWDFAFEINEVARQQAEQANIKMRFVRIPREVLEKKAVEQGDIRFYELAALSVDMQQSGKSLTIRLTDFIMDCDDVPADVQKAVKKWEQWIDYWAVDWDYKGDTFHNQWQSYRTRKEKALALQTATTYKEPGTYTVVVKVIDILGNDTTKTLNITVG